MEKVFYPLAFADLIHFCRTLFQTYYVKQGHSMMVICSTLFLVWCMVYIVSKKVGRDNKWLLLLPYVYFLIAAVGTTLVYKDWLPESFKDGGKEHFEFMILLNFLLVN